MVKKLDKAKARANDILTDSIRQEQKDIRESATRSTEQLIVLASTYSAPLSIFMHRLSTT